MGTLTSLRYSGLGWYASGRGRSELDDEEEADPDVLQELAPACSSGRSLLPAVWSLVSAARKVGIIGWGVVRGPVSSPS